MGQLTTTPHKEKVKHLLAYVKEIFEVNKQTTMKGIIWLLNLVIRGWEQYYSQCNAKWTFSYVDHQVF